MTKLKDGGMRKRHSVKAQSKSIVESEILDTLNTSEALAKSPAGSATKMTKYLKTPIDTANSERLYRLITTSPEIDDIVDFLDFIKTQWSHLRVFLANDGTRHSHKLTPYTLQALADDYRRILNLYTYYQDCEATFLHRIGKIDNVNLEVMRRQQIPEKVWAETLAENKRLVKKFNGLADKYNETVREKREAVQKIIKLAPIVFRYIKLRKPHIPYDTIMDHLEDIKFSQEVEDVFMECNVNE